VQNWEREPDFNIPSGPVRMLVMWNWWSDTCMYNNNGLDMVGAKKI
jgi:hypothetical protein